MFILWCDVEVIHCLYAGEYMQPDIGKSIADGGLQWSCNWLAQIEDPTKQNPDNKLGCPAFARSCAGFPDINVLFYHAAVSNK